MQSGILLQLPAIKKKNDIEMLVSLKKWKQ
jgi:hypothetical protein